MKNNKLDIFEQNAEFFERFNNSLEDTANDRHDRTRFTVTGLENKVEFAVTNAEGRIKKAEDDAVDRLNQVNGMTNEELISKSAGTGKWMREGAYGIGGQTTMVTPQENVRDFQYGFYSVSTLSQGKPPSMRSAEPFLSMGRDNYNTQIYSLVGKGTLGLGFNRNGSWTESELISDKNTRTDKNNVLHNGTGTPINTLNASDMAQDVVNRDDITVTSGAVYRVIQELRAEIALLKGKLNE